MAWNPSPKVAVARDIANKWKANEVIIITIDDDQMQAVTYGRTKQLCAHAKSLGDAAYDAIYDYIELEMEKQ